MLDRVIRRVPRVTWQLAVAAVWGGAAARPVLGQAPTASIPAPAPLSLAETYARIQAGNPRVAAADALAQAAAYRVTPAGRPPDPQLQFGLMNRSLPGFDISNPLGMNQVQLMQMLPFPGKLGFARQVATGRADAARARATDVRWDVRARAAMAFYDVYAMDRSLEVAHETLRLLQVLAKIAETMYSVGDGRQPDVLRAQVEIARMTEEIARMEAERVSAAARLNALLAVGPDVPVGTPQLPAFPERLPALDSLVQEAAAQRPMVRAGEQELLAAKAASQLARREIWPDLQFGLQYGQRPMADGGTDRMLSLMMGFTLPVFGRQVAMRHEAEAMQLMTDADLANTRAETRGRVGELYAAAERSRRLSDLYRGTILPQTETTVQSSQAAYRVGSVDFLTALDARLTLNRYRQDLIRLEAERGQSLAELEMLLGRELFDPRPATEVRDTQEKPQ